MKRSIILEETVKYHHRIVVNYKDESELDEAIQNTESCNSLENFVDAINEIVPVCQVDEDWAEDVDSIEYYDDYPTELDEGIL